MRPNSPKDAPEDWPKEGPGFLPMLDELLRCTICKTPFDAPMLLPDCGHSYCSLCIRKHLRQENYCPSCRTPVQEKQLVKVKCLEEVVLLFRRHRANTLSWMNDRVGRTGILDGEARREEDPVVEKPPTTYPSSTPPKVSEEPKMIPGSPSPSPSQIDNPCPICGNGLPNNPAKAERHVNLCMDGREKEASAMLDSPSGSSGVSAGSSATPKKVGIAGYVTPLTPGYVTLSSPGSPMDSASGLTTPKAIIPPKIPRPIYHTMKDRQLREMLAKHHLITTGSREAMIKRMKRFVIHYDANRDRAHPLSAHELVRQLARMEKNEEDEERAASSSGETRSGKMGEDEMKQHEIKYQDEFAALILEVKQRSKRGPEEGHESSDGASDDKRVKTTDKENQ
ncbi:hypothetical protein BJ684DRAFT_14464 [Piptocephalis cylindrospora]|uniref:Postreplication repair E3 ubiquitin-protein ligase RAD18 n=1 Tax=Piptocephalis cylindrospora TaxID=1907219 RepID=A0A4P9Y7Y5_9FUNG|nr:hypothetical protein BJ684DRAFT_14464 [Piptocephalis cylindrospora]|eukprot:RKP15267.1 hypothetical protein BJ684DRAFT_14464 [Piptocephalis cylindrospora]